MALQAVATSGDETGKADLEKENANLRKELLFLPELKTELESLRARVTELSQLIGITWQTLTGLAYFHYLFTPYKELKSLRVFVRLLVTFFSLTLNHIHVLICWQMISKRLHPTQALFH